MKREAEYAPFMAFVARMREQKDQHFMMGQEGYGFDIWLHAKRQATALPKCETCGTHEVSLERTCHNSDCASYADEITIHEGWK